MMKFSTQALKAPGIDAEMFEAGQDPVGHEVFTYTANGQGFDAHFLQQQLRRCLRHLTPQ